MSTGQSTGAETTTADPSVAAPSKQVVVTSNHPTGTVRAAGTSTTISPLQLEEPTPAIPAMQTQATGRTTITASSRQPVAAAVTPHIPLSKITNNINLPGTAPTPSSVTAGPVDQETLSSDSKSLNADTSFSLTSFQSPNPSTLVSQALHKPFTGITSGATPSTQATAVTSTFPTLGRDASSAGTAATTVIATSSAILGLVVLVSVIWGLFALRRRRRHRRLRHLRLHQTTPFSGAVGHRTGGEDLSHSTLDEKQRPFNDALLVPSTLPLGDNGLAPSEPALSLLEISAPSPHRGDPEQLYISSEEQRIFPERESSCIVALSMTTTATECDEEASTLVPAKTSRHIVVHDESEGSGTSLPETGIPTTASLDRVERGQRTPARETATLYERCGS